MLRHLSDPHTRVEYNGAIRDAERLDFPDELLVVLITASGSSSAGTRIIGLRDKRAESGVNRIGRCGCANRLIQYHSMVPSQSQ